MQELEKYDAARHALQAAASVDEVKEIRNKSLALAAYAKQAKDKDLLSWASEIKIRAERRAGELLIDMEKAKGATEKNTRRGTIKVPRDDQPKTLAALGISKNQSSHWQSVAAISEENFEKAILESKQDNIEITTPLILKLSKPHVSNNSGENEWYTPYEFIEAALLTMGSIDLDPASSELANKTVKATEFYTAKNNGLTEPWTGNVWLNPPYAQPLISQFCDKLALELSAINQAIVLINNATETKWFQGIAELSSSICFPSSRIKFIDKQGNRCGAPLQGQALLYFGDNRVLFKRNFSKFGLILYYA